MRFVGMPFRALMSLFAAFLVVLYLLMNDTFLAKMLIDDIRKFVWNGSKTR